MLLALDTATPAVTVALADGDRLLAERTTVDARRHGELLAPAIDAVLAEAGVDRTALTAIAVGVGPGPFTGLRVGLVTARTLGAVLGIPVLGVCTLDVLALGSGLDGEFRVVTDARRTRGALGGVPRSTRATRCASTGRTSRRPPTRRTTGRRSVPAPSCTPTRSPATARRCTRAPRTSPRWVARGLPTVAPDPLYLRRPDAAEPGARKSVLSRPQP